MCKFISFCSAGILTAINKVGRKMLPLPSFLQNSDARTKDQYGSVKVSGRLG
jgi:hypothetical protein